jgi:hypothetical protein
MDAASPLWCGWEAFRGVGLCLMIFRYRYLYSAILSGEYFWSGLGSHIADGWTWTILKSGWINRSYLCDNIRDSEFKSTMDICSPRPVRQGRKVNYLSQRASELIFLHPKKYWRWPYLESLGKDGTCGWRVRC